MLNRKIRLLCITQKRQDMTYEKQVELACLGGADMIQFRDKSMDKKSLIETSKRLNKICCELNVLFTINDDPGIAFEVACDGVHIGQTDMCYDKARKLLPNAIIGVSAQTIDEAKIISKSDADYIGLGPIYFTQSKQTTNIVGIEGLKKVSNITTKPVIAIGGIDLTNVKEVIHNGATGVAVIRAVCGAKNIKDEAKKIKEAVLEAQRGK